MRVIFFYLLAIRDWAETCLGRVGRLGVYPQQEAQAAAVVIPEPAEAELDAKEAAGRALGLLGECISLIDALEDRPAGTWPPLDRTFTGRLLVEELRPELVEIASEMRADRRGGADAEAEALALLPKIYILLDRAEAELADA